MGHNHAQKMRQLRFRKELDDTFTALFSGLADVTLSLLVVAQTLWVGTRLPGFRNSIVVLFVRQTMDTLDGTMTKFVP